MFDGTPESVEKMSPAEKFEFSYNKVLDGFLQTVDEWARLSLEHSDGKMSAEEVIDSFNQHVGLKAMVLLILDEIRRNSAIEKQVEKFRKDLNGI